MAALVIHGRARAEQQLNAFYRALRRGRAERRGALGVRFDTVSYSDFAANFTDFRQLGRARSRLYQSRFLQPNTHFAAFFEIYKNIIFS